MYRTLAKTVKKDFNHFDLDQEIHSDSDIKAKAQPKLKAAKEVAKISVQKPVDMSVNSVPFTKKMTKKESKKNDPKQNLLRQSKYFDHSKYHDAPNANDVPMDLFD